jgi:hypothetical protein
MCWCPPSACLAHAAHPLVPIVTDRRELFVAVLPKEWPIIDL